MKPKVDKLLQKKLAPILSARNRATTAHSFGKLRTKADLLHFAGLETNITYDDIVCQVTYKQVHDFFQPFIDEASRPPCLALYKYVPWNTYKPTGKEVSTDTDPDEPLNEQRLPDSPLMTCKLYPFQDRASYALAKNIVEKKYRGQLLRAEVGTGKTFMIGRLLRYLIDIGWFESSHSPWPAVIVTKVSVVEQTKRVLKNMFGITEEQVHVLNIEQLRSEFGKLMVTEKVLIKDGVECIEYIWRRNIHPKLILFDECQILKNTDTTQSQIAQSFSDIPAEVYQVFFSATPFLRVNEAKCFAVSTKKEIKYGVGVAQLDNFHWPSVADELAGNDKPTDYSQTAIKRLMSYFNDYIVDVKGVRPQFKALNSVQMIDFETREDYDFYQKAYERYLEQKAKLESSDMSAGESRWMILVELLMFRKAAELIRAKYLARVMYESVQAGKAAVCACNFKSTIKKIVQVLHEDFNVSRDNISLIWGGGKTKATKRQKKKAKVDDILHKFDLDEEDKEVLYGEFNLDSVQDYIEEELDPSLELGIQSKVQRQAEIDRFQSGKSLYCLFTLKAGGVGLSLHHTDELTERKVRRKKNNFAIVEYIPNIPTRPRESYIAPTYSAIELVQSLGRAPRLTSLSNTNQLLVFYRGTVEERVAQIVNIKLRCLKEVVRTAESWEDVISTPEKAQQHMKEITVSEADADSAELIGTEVEE